jgi:hypothetical protein
MKLSSGVPPAAQSPVLTGRLLPKLARMRPSTQPAAARPPPHARVVFSVITSHQNTGVGPTKGEPNAWRLTELGERVTEQLALSADAHQDPAHEHHITGKASAHMSKERDDDCS